MTLHIPGARLVAALGLAVALTQVAPVPGASAAGGITDTPDVTTSFNAPVRAVAYHAGVVYVGGEFTEAVDSGRTYVRNHVAAIDPATGHLLPWNPNTDGWVYALAVSDTAVYLGGSFARVGGALHERIAKVSTSTGAVDSSFTAGTDALVRALAVSSTRLYAGGTFATVNGQPQPFLAALDPGSGAFDPGWRPQVDDMVRTFTFGNGYLYVGGSFTMVNGQKRGGHLAPLDPVTGALAAVYTSSIPYPVHGIVATPSVLYAAADGPGGHLRAVTVTGSPLWDLAADGGVQAVTLLDGTLYAGGHMDNVCTTVRTGPKGVCLDGSVRRRKLFAATTAGALLPWDPEANSALGAYSLDSDPTSGRVFAGGAWTTFNYGHTSQPGFAEFG